MDLGEPPKPCDNATAESSAVLDRDPGDLHGSWYSCLVLVCLRSVDTLHVSWIQQVPHDYIFNNKAVEHAFTKALESEYMITVAPSPQAVVDHTREQATGLSINVVFDDDETTNLENSSWSMRASRMDVYLISRQSKKVRDGHSTETKGNA